MFARPLFDVGGIPFGWSFLHAIPVNKSNRKNFVVSREMLPLHTWKYRTAIVQIGNTWEVVEHGKYLDGPLVLDDNIPGI